MRRVLVTALLVAASSALALGAGGDRGDADAPTYTLEVDNAFGIVDDGDVKVAGVRSGVVTDVRLDRRTLRARVGIRIDQRGFGSLRRDARCEVRNQSLLGEYFIDCLPGTARQELPGGSTIPVERTASTIPPDLVLNLMERPYRERLRLIIGELGAGAAGNSENLNSALRRAVPALRETDRVLAALAQENRQLRQAVEDADAVLARLAGQRRDAGRFVTEARDTMRAGAARRSELATDLHRLPGFLRELTPAMTALGDLAGSGAPAVRDLGASGAQLEVLLRNGRRLAEVGGPAVEALGKATDRGVRAIRAARPVVAELRRGVRGFPELAGNLSIILEHLDDRDFAVEPDPRSPGGKGYTGLEAALRFVFYSSLVVNSYDAETRIAKAAISVLGRCGKYTSVEDLREDPTLERDCASRAGPTAAGIYDPDPTRPEGASDTRRRSGARGRRERRGGDDRSGRPERTLDGEAPPAARPPAAPEIPLPSELRDLLQGLAPSTRDEQPSDPLLDFLFGR